MVVSRRCRRRRSKLDSQTRAATLTSTDSTAERIDQRLGGAGQTAMRLGATLKMFGGTDFHNVEQWYGEIPAVWSSSPHCTEPRSMALT
jgi:hypothetical protein